MFHGINNSMFDNEVLPMGTTWNIANAPCYFSKLQKMLNSTTHLAPEALGKKLQACIAASGLCTAAGTDLSAPGLS